MAFNFPMSPAPTVGQTFTPSGGPTYTWNGYAWSLPAAGGGGGGASITISDTAPASPVAGALWWQSNTGKLWIYYNDGNSLQWVVAGEAPPANASINVRTFTTSQAYVPSPGLISAIVEAVAGGAGGGGANGASTVYTGAGGGGSGAYARRVLTAAQIGASQSITIGPAGAGGSAGNNPGANGGDTSFGALVVAKGGLGGSAGASGGGLFPGGAGGPIAGCVGDFFSAGAPGGQGQATATVWGITGEGGSSIFGGGAPCGASANIAGNNASNYGSGGSGANSYSAAAAGGNGSPGVCVVTEFINITVAQQQPGLVLLNTLDASVNQVGGWLSDTTSFSSLYDTYEIELINLVPVTASVYAQMQLYVGGAWATGGNYFSTAGGAYTSGFGSSAGYGADVQSGVTQFNISGVGTQGAVNNAVSYGISGLLRLHGVNQSWWKMLTGNISYLSASNMILAALVGGCYPTASTIGGIRFGFNNGSIASGKIRIYGRKTS